LVRHLVESLVSGHSPRFARESSVENERLRAKFRLDDEPHEVVLHEYACALVHAEGSSKGKLYVTQHYLCFAGSLFGKETRAVYPLDDVLAVELADIPPNTISIASTTAEERFTFFGQRGHAMATISTLLALSRGDHLRPEQGQLCPAPQEPAQLTPIRFLDKPKPPSPPHATLPLQLQLGSASHLVGTVWRYPVKAPISTGCPCTVLVQAPLALQNLLPDPLEWRLLYKGAVGGSSNEPLLERRDLPPSELHALHELAWGQKYAVQLRLPGYEWSGSIELDTQQTSDRLEMVRLRPSIAGIKTLRLHVQHRSTCACSYHLLQVYATHWLINGTGLTLQFRVGKKLTTHDPASHELEEAAVTPRLKLTDLSSSAFVAEEEIEQQQDQVARDQQTMLFSVARGAKHLMAVRVASDAISRSTMRQTLGQSAAAEHDLKGSSGGGWSPPFSLLTTPSLGGAAVRSLRAGQHDLAIQIATYEHADHDRIRVVTFMQRFWLTNRLELALEAVQWSSDPRLEGSMPLASGERTPFHWPNQKEERLLRVRPAPGHGGFLPQADEGWSSGFPIDAPGTFVVQCEQGVRPHEEAWWDSLLRILVTVRLVEARIEVTFEIAPPAPPPYRIVNKTSYMLSCAQKGSDTSARSPHRVMPNASAPFAWAESTLEHILLVTLSWSQTEVVKARPGVQPWRSTQYHPLVKEQPLPIDAMLQSFGLGTDPKTPIAWGRVELQDGVRVLTVTEKKDDETRNGPNDDNPSMMLNVDVAGFGVSLTHIGYEELLFISLVNISLDFVLSERSASLEVKLHSFQVDNQQNSATLPAVLSLQNPSSDQPALHVSIEKQLRRAGGPVNWWEYVSCRVLELDMAGEPSFVQALLDFVVAAKLPELVRAITQAQAQARPCASEAVRSLPRRAELLRYGAPQSMQYFRKLELHPVKLNLTFRQGEGTLPVPIPHIDGAPITLGALLREHLYGTVEDLGASVGNHYKYALLRQIYKVVLQVDMLGDPVSLARQLGTGVKDLFYLPAQAVVKSPRQFGKAMAQGSASFARNTMIAPINSFGKWVNFMERSVDRGLTALDMNLSKGPSASQRTGGKMLVQGAAGLGMGVFNGAIGLVKEPVKGARSEGLRGFGIGIGKGLVGAAMLPTAGVLQLAGRAAGAVQHLGGEGEASTHSARLGRVRPPRMLHPSQPLLVPYALGEALAQHVLQSAGEGKYLQEQLLHCDLLQAAGGSTVVVLTGMRLLCVETTNWKLTTNLLLRKVHSVSVIGDALLLQYVTRRGAAEKGSAAAGEQRRVACFSKEAATKLEAQVGDAVLAARARATNTKRHSRNVEDINEPSVSMPTTATSAAFSMLQPQHASSFPVRATSTTDAKHNAKHRQAPSGDHPHATHQPAATAPSAGEAEAQADSLFREKSAEFRRASAEALADALFKEDSDQESTELPER